jgi:hypothetical protein
MPVLSGQILARDAAGHWQAAPGRLSHSDGVIADVTPAGAASDTLILPALSNAHDHGRGLRTVAFGAGDDALEVWIAALGREPATDPYLRAAVAFARMAEAGIATLNHCHNTADPERLVEEAEAVSRAARDVGVRVAFAVPISGRNPLTYGDPGPLFDRLPPHRPRPSGRAPERPTPASNSPWSRRSPVSSTTLPRAIRPRRPAMGGRRDARPDRRGLRDRGTPRAHAPLRDRVSEGMGRGRLSRRSADPSRCDRPPVRAADGGPWRPSRRGRLRAAGRAGRACLGQHLVQPAPALGSSAGGAVPAPRGALRPRPRRHGLRR